MSLGNGKPKNGDKGSNFSYELKSLMQLSNLSSLLADLITVTEDINEDAEILLVRDTANGDIIVQQIRIYDRLLDVWTTSYQNLDGTDYVPVLPPAYEYLDSSSTLSQVIGADGLPHGGPEQKGFRVLGTDGTNDYELSTNALGQLQVNIVSSALPTGAATEATLDVVKTNTTGVARTPGIIRPTAAGNVSGAASTFYSVSVANVGTADGSILGGTNNIKPGEVLNFSGDALNNFFTSFAYDATGTEFLITYIY